MTPSGACILSSDGPRLTADEKALFRDADPFGFILFARHIETPDQVRALCSEFREAVGRDCLVTIDQEGGRVQRLRGPTWRDWLPPLDHVEAAGTQAARAMYLRARLIAHELRDLGIDSDCMPTLDIAGDRTHPFLRNRCYGTAAVQVTENGRATADGLLDGGVVPVMKHMPGHGRATLDTHHDLPTVDTDIAELAKTDFAPFHALSSLPMGMTAHVIFSALDSRPATLSPVCIDAIRTKIGFQGLLMTDDISMQALSGSLADRTRAALDAGCDLVLHCNDTFSERAEVAEAAGAMTATASARAKAALAARRSPDPIDIPAMEAELETLLNGRVYV
jgi:beta-N-acetylhexosaminidase